MNRFGVEFIFSGIRVRLTGLKKLSNITLIDTSWITAFDIVDPHYPFFTKFTYSSMITRILGPDFTF